MLPSCALLASMADGLDQAPAGRQLIEAMHVCWGQQAAAQGRAESAAKVMPLPCDANRKQRYKGGLPGP